MSISNSSTRYGMVWQRQQVDVEKERWSGRNIIITHRSTVPSSRTTSTTIQPQIHKIHNMRKCIKLKYTTWSLPTIISSSTTNTTNSQLFFLQIWMHKYNYNVQCGQIQIHTCTQKYNYKFNESKTNTTHHPTVPSTNGTTSQESTVQIQPTRGKSPVELFYRQKTSSPVNFSKMNFWNKYCIIFACFD